MNRPDELDEEDLLAFARGEASADVSARIKEVAATDTTFRAELTLASGLKNTLAAATDGPDTREFGWRRLEAEIAKSPDNTPIQGDRPQFWRFAAMFLGALVIAQGSYIALVPGTGDAPVFQTVSEEVTGFTFRVAFKAEASMTDIDALLKEYGAQIVDGPSAIGLYRLSFETESAMAAARVHLSTSPLINLLAEE